jgi:hypothetical protein
MRLSLLFVGSMALALLTPSASAQNTTPHGSVSPAHVPAYSGESGQRPADKPQLPRVIYTCERSDCTNLGGLWVFEGTQGQALWHVGAMGAVTIKQFDGKHIVVDRADPPGTFSSRLKPGPDGYFRAEYTGTINGPYIEGTETWVDVANFQPVPWSATIKEDACGSGESCPLTAKQIGDLGLNAFKAKLYSSAYILFKIDGDAGYADAQAYEAIALSKMHGGPEKDKEAFRLAQMSASKCAVGMGVLGKFYQKGIGTEANPELGAELIRKAYRMADEEEAQDAASARTGQGFAIGKWLTGAMNDSYEWEQHCWHNADPKCNRD